MSNWLARIERPATAGLAVLLLVAGGACFAPAASAAESKKELPLSEEVAKKLKPAQDACQKNDFDACIAAARDGLATP